MNMYDIKLRDKTPSDGCGLGWPDNLPLLYKYLAQVWFTRSSCPVTYYLG